MDTRGSFQSVQQAFAQEHFVPDVLLPTSSLIFILESPHVQELKFGAPVCGASGATMSKHLFGQQYAKFPLGRLVKTNAEEEKHRPRFDRIGLLNVSNVPLQAAAYLNKELIRENSVWMQAMEHVRSSNQTTIFRDAAMNEVQEVLVDSLRQKLSLLSHRSCTIVPCGRFAQKFFHLANIQSRYWNVIEGVPHPSFSWDRAVYQDAINQVKEALDAGLLKEV